MRLGRGDSTTVASSDEFLRTAKFSALDGLRAISVVAVIWHHTSGWPGPLVFTKGYMGVDFFFAISGFLITTLLLREQRRTGDISLRKFYVRRCLRIFPVYYAVLGVYVVLVALTRSGTEEGRQFWENLPSFLTYTSNWFVDLDPAHSVTFYFAWSLAAEEQFYLLWPPILVALVIRWPGKIVPPLVALTVLITVSQVALAVGDPSHLAWRIIASPPLPILLGAGFAVVLNNVRGFGLAAPVLGRSMSAPIVFVALGLTLVLDAPHPAIQVAMVLAVVSVCMFEGTPMHRLLEFRPLAFIGVISYGMYLMHMLCANAARKLVHQEYGIALFIVTTIATVVVAYISFRYFERPILRYKRRFETRDEKAGDELARFDDTGESRRSRPSQAATRLMKAMCAEFGGPNRRWRRRILIVLRRTWLLRNDPVVEYSLDGTPLVLPLSHDLPINRAAYPKYSANLGDVVAAVAKRRESVSVIDIGANVGDSVAIVRARANAAILCVEGDPEFLPYLERNTRALEGVEIARCYIASADMDLASMTVERSRGTAQLVDGSRGVARDAVLPLVSILEQHPAFDTPAVIKIDTDGHDAGIIRSFAPWLADKHPVLFFEFDPRMTRSVGASDPISLFAELAVLRYSTLVLYTNTGELVGRFDAADDRLRGMAEELGTEPAPPYWDVVAVHDSDTDLVGELT